MTRALMIGVAAAALTVAGCAQPYPQHAYGDPYAYPYPAPATAYPSGGAMTSPVTRANAPIPDTPENRARYGGPQSRAGKRSPYERPY